MRSCLRRPLAPGSSRLRAILVSSVMFFSFNSEIVIVVSPTEDFAEGRAGGNLRETRLAPRRARHLHSPRILSLSRASLGFGSRFGFEQDRMPLRVGNAMQH